VYPKIDMHKKEHNFEIFGLDFMIDESFTPWLIEINTNPCLELSSPLLTRLIPQMIENSFRYHLSPHRSLSLDLLFPPPAANLWPPSKKHLLFYDNLLENNRFQLIFDERYDSQELRTSGLDEYIDEMDEIEEEFNSDNEDTKIP
jgi:tubulin polyglutamylase TTLL1/tubulin monoglycylase TTLL3/8